MFKKIAIFSFLAFAFIGCDKTAQQTVNTNVSAQSSDNSPLVSGHSQAHNGNLSASPQTVAPVQKSETKTKWTQSGNPIDTSAFDAEIAKTTKNLKVKPKDDAAKKSLAEAYLKRGTALTQVGQYASALGDYRRVLKYDADNQDAKTWINKILEIYDSINREYPKEGEEPPPLR